MFCFMLSEVSAGPPKGMVKQMIPFPAMCLPATAAQNPATGLAGVLMITDEQTCIAFSGEDRKEFIRPPDHPMGEANEDTKA